jgi:prophage antirepressor-like protein
VIDRDGVPWFVLADVCRTLKLSRHKGAFSHHAEKLDSDEKMMADRNTVLAATP